jgi:hypothetical protein
MKTSNLQRVVSAVKTLTDEPCEIGHDWKRSAELKLSKKERKKERKKKRKKERKKEGKKERKKERKKEGKKEK